MTGQEDPWKSRQPVEATHGKERLCITEEKPLRGIDPEIEARAMACLKKSRTGSEIREHDLVPSGYT